jgi:hypothetical protein
MDTDATRWAREEFGQADLGDLRRTARLVTMAARLLTHPGGKVTQVFGSGAEREGAYRWLENQEIPYESVVNAAACAGVRRCQGYDFVFVVVDGTSATLADSHGRLDQKDFGCVGTTEAGSRGIEVVSAIAFSPTGEPLGLCAQRQWTRRPPKKGPKRSKWRVRDKGAANAKHLAQIKRRERQRERMRRCQSRPVQDKETRHWIDVVQATKRRFEEQAPKTRCWFQIDRQGDAWTILNALVDERSDDLFTVRAAWNRCVTQPDGTRSYLRNVLATQPVLGGYVLDVTARAGKRRTGGHAHRSGRPAHRTARRAHMEVRAASVVLDTRNRRTDRRYALALNAVWAHEVSTTPSGEDPVDWLLLTTHPVDHLEHARQVIDAYSYRWRIEEVHKTWKSGGCQLEQSQLHKAATVMKWSTLLLAVAIRTERIKHLARTSPDLPASVELSPFEIHALLLLKRQQKKRTETVLDTMPTIAQAARWIADLGGYTGKSSGGPFGSITLGRGLEWVIIGGQVLKSLEEETKM